MASVLFRAIILCSWGRLFTQHRQKERKCLSVSRLFYFRLFPICVRERIVVGSLQSCLWKQVLPLGKTSLFSKIHATHSSTWEFGVQGLQDTVFFCWLRFLAKLFILSKTAGLSAACSAAWWTPHGMYLLGFAGRTT